MALPDKYCPTVGCFIPKRFAISVCDKPLCLIASINLSRILSSIIIVYLLNP